MSIAVPPFKAVSGRPKLHAGVADEVQLWNEFRGGDERAFALLYDRYVVPLYNYGERLTHDKELIEDSIQDLFVELWKNHAGLGPTSSVKFYLYKAFKNRLVKNLHKVKSLTGGKIPDEYDFEMVLSPEFSYINEEISDRQKQKLLEVVNMLAPRQKEALTLRFFDGLSYEEMASLMSLPVKSIYMLVYRAIGFLRENLREEFFVVLAAFFSSAPRF